MSSSRHVTHLDGARPEAAVGGQRFAHVLDRLCALNDHGFIERGRHALPSRAAIAGLIDDLRAVLYPVHFGNPAGSSRSLRLRIGESLDKAQLALREQIRRGLLFACGHSTHGAECVTCAERANELTDIIVGRLAAIRAVLDTDIEAAFSGDPAAKSRDETLFCYPGVSAILQHRIAHELSELSVPLIPRIISELAHSSTGIDIHPGAQIGSSFFIDHGTGVVIGETSLIGSGVRLYQGVTLGARNFVSDQAGQLTKGLLRHPIVEDDVVIYAGATILGRITIGKGAIIGGNVWVTRSVPAGSRITQVQARQETFENGSGI
jgi:serine O-acetyltransferase